MKSALTLWANLEAARVFKELRENNEVPDVVITVRSSYTPFLLNTLIFRGVTSLRLIAIG